MQLAEKRAQLTNSNNRYRTLRHQRLTLLTRIQTSASTAAPPLATPEDTITTGDHNQDAHRHDVSAQAGVHRTSAAIETVKSLVPTRAGHSGNFFTEYDELPRPISSFSHCAGTPPQVERSKVPFYGPHGKHGAVL